MPGKKSYGRARRFMRLRGGQPQQRAPNQRDDDRPGPSTECGSGSDGTSPALSPLTSGATESTAVLLTMDQSSASGSSSSSPSANTVSTSSESLPDLQPEDTEEEMPLRLPRLRLLRKSKETLQEPSKDKPADATSVASLSSLASDDSVWAVQGPEENCGYVVTKLKELSKLHKAVWKDDLRKVNAALASLKKPMYVDYYDKDHRTALHFACARGQDEIVRAICGAGASTNIADSNGATPLHKIIESGRSAGLKHLLDNHGDPNVADELGRSPLHIAAKTGDIAAAALLLERDANIDSIEKNGMTPLHVATVNGHLGFVSRLISDGSNVDYQDGLGRTCLMMAAAGGSTDLVRLFVENKADPSLTDKQGLKALDFAVSRNHHDSAHLLEEHEKEVESERQRTAPVPRRASLVDTTLLSSVYGLGGPATNRFEDDTPSQSEDILSPRPEGGDSWGASDTDDDLDPPRQTTMNLKAALHHKGMEGSPESEAVVGPSVDSKPVDISVAMESKVQVPPATSHEHAHYQLSMPSEDRPTTPTPWERELVSDSSERTVSSRWDSDNDDYETSPFDLPDDSPRKLPSVVTVNKRSATSDLAEPTPAQIESVGPSVVESHPPPSYLDVGAVSRDTSNEGMRTVDEEISEFDSEDDSLDYVEDVVREGSSYVPSTPEKSLRRGNPLTRSESVGIEAGDSCETSEKVGFSPETRSPDGSLFAVTPLSSGHFTSEFLSPDEEPGQLAQRPVTGHSGRRAAAPASNEHDDLSEILESEDEDIDRLLNEAEQLAPTNTPVVDSEPEYGESDWDSDEASDDENEEEPQVSALNSMSGPCLPDPFLSPPLSPKAVRKSASAEAKETPKPDVQQVSAQGPAHSEAPPSDGESESEVNFDSEEELDIAGLLPCSDNKDEGPTDHLTDGHTPNSVAQSEATPLSPLLSARRSGSLSPLASPNLSPLHSASSPSKLPPLTISTGNVGRLSPLRLPSSLSNEQGLSLSPPRLGPIANKQGLTPSPPKLSDQSSMDSETESEWEREMKEKKKNLSLSQQFDSGLDTMTTVVDDVAARENPLSQRVSTCVDSLKKVAKIDSTCVDPQQSTSVDVTKADNAGQKDDNPSRKDDNPGHDVPRSGSADQTAPSGTDTNGGELDKEASSTVSHKKPSSQSNSEPSLNTSPSGPSGRLPPLRLPGRGSASHESVDMSQIQAYKSLWDKSKKSDLPPSEKEDDPVIDLPPSEKEDDPVIESTTESLMPFSGETEEALPTSGIPAQPSEESILEMLSETEDYDDEDKEDDLEADFSGSKLHEDMLTFEPTTVPKTNETVTTASSQSQTSVAPALSSHLLTEPSKESLLSSERLSSKDFSLSDQRLSRETSKDFSTPDQRLSRETSKDFSTPDQRLSRETSKDFSTPDQRLSRETSNVSLSSVPSQQSRAFSNPSLSSSISDTKISHERSLPTMTTSSETSVDRPETTAIPSRVSTSSLGLPRAASKDGISRAPSKDLETLPEDKPVGRFTSSSSKALASSSNEALSSSVPTSSSSAELRGNSPSYDSLAVTSEEEVRAKPLKLVVTSLTATSSGDLKEEFARMETGTSELAPGSKVTLSAESLRTVSASKATPSLYETTPYSGTKSLATKRSSAAGIKRGASVSDSHLEAQRRPGLKAEGDELITDDDFTVDSEESELSLTPGLTHQPHLSSLFGYPHDNTLTRSQLHAPTLSPITLGETRDDLPPDLSYSDLTSTVGTHASQEMLSQSSKMSDDLPLSHLLRLNQSLRSSQIGGASLLGSAQTAQLHESLLEANHSLERSHEDKDRSERVKRQLESRLDDYQRKYSDAMSCKMNLENSKLDLELQVRELKYQLDQSREGMKSNEGVCSQLREQLDRMEIRLSHEIESRQTAELKRREVEIAHRSLSVSQQQMQEELGEVTGRLQGEREAKILQEGLYKEQTRMYETIREESKKAQELKSEFLNKLESSDATRRDLQRRLSDLTKAHSELQTEFTAEKRRAEEVEGQLECVQQELKGNFEKQAHAEDSLHETQTQFESHLTELKEKAEFLSVTLESEANQRSEAQQEVSALQSRLESTTIELQTVVRQTGEKESLLTQQLEELRQEKALREKDFKMTRDLHSQQTSRAESLEAKLQGAENELKSTSTLLHERANQITGLQRDVEHKQASLTALNATLKCERDRQSKIELQLDAASEKVASLQTETSGLRQKAEFAERRAAEREASSQQMQARSDTLQSSLRAEYEKSKKTLEQQCQTLRDNQTSLREELARREAGISGLERERDDLKTQVSNLQTGQTDLTQTLQATEEAYREQEEERNEILDISKEMEEKIAELTSALSTQHHQTCLLQEKVAGYKASLSEAHDTTRVALEEKQSALEQKDVVDARLVEVQKSICSLETELESGQERERSLETNIERLNEARSTLQTRLSEQQTELHETRSELEQLTTAHSKAVTEAEEARGLWENEVKSKSKLGMKLIELERTHGDTDKLVDVEKRRTRKALEIKKGVEWKLDSLQKHNTKITTDLATARTHLKLFKRRIQELELTQSQVPEMRAELNREQATLHCEMESMKQLVVSTQAHLKREVEKRHRTEQTTSKVRQELEEANTRITLGNSQSQSRRKEVVKLERTNKKIREELSSLQEHVATFMVSKVDMDAYKKAVEEKAHRELSRKLDEVNLHLEQQSQAQETLARLRMDTESQQRDKFDRSSVELRTQLSQSESDKTTALTEARRYKELYEAELQRSSNLSSLLQRAREESIESQNKLSHERNRTQQLLNVTQTAVGGLSPPRTRHPFTESHTHAYTSTPLQLTPRAGSGDHSPTSSTSLLNSVRAKLDQSIASYRDRMPPGGSISTANRSTYSPSQSPHGSLEKKLSHLDSIKRTYRI